MAAFIREQVRPGVELPPPPPATSTSAEMRKRPAGIRAMTRAFDEFQFARDRLTATTFPVYFGYGNLTSEYEAVKASVLARRVPDIHIQRFDGVHHFVPPEQIYTPAHATTLRQLWLRTEV